MRPPHSAPGSSARAPFAGDCRRFLRQLPDLVLPDSIARMIADGDPGTGVAGTRIAGVWSSTAATPDGATALWAARHAEQCPRCAAHLRAARGHAACLGRQVAGVALPAELEPEVFLARVHERVVETSRATCSELVGQLQRVPAPGDAVWHQDRRGERPALAVLLRGAAAPPTAPAWVWQRIRADVRRQRAACDAVAGATWRRTAWRAGLLAATLLVSGLLTAILMRLGSESQGTRSSFPIVWYSASEPPAEAASPTGLVSMLGR